MKLLITGGAGFIGSHVAERYARKGHEIVIFDNLSRATLLKKMSFDPLSNWKYLAKYPNIQRIKGDVRHQEALDEIVPQVDVIVHAAAQTAVTTSVVEPAQDFTTNVLGTFHLLEAARRSPVPPAIIFCSTNKVYGDNVNAVEIEQAARRYQFCPAFQQGISERFSTDLCEHTPYGCSKLTGDLYMQDYAHLYGLKIGVFRMSCIYGPRQMGVEDQGWVAWFTIAALSGKPITIYGDGKQVRDVLYIDDLLEAYDAFLRSDLRHGVYNIGGGSQHTLSLLELLDLLEASTGKRCQVQFSAWRPSDQKVYISDIAKIRNELHWSPTISPEAGVQRVVEWVRATSDL
ncbi:NAD-dependent epimerase/dehydratase family protein [candidate division KSB3 bacterium]|uniref:NAD-dependent epimerase/dehydratase family protein n=1 Tax=candidate division KSB3 bacterium TaxID=2044937 RepID=A0A9D5JWE8_9BACT|nr:NAD-dependent epimerase/dehydratase family protein [candidate division KSB3 bacterium]MBD3325384.1 NAD-dependent epimerase/dehydratase family protein [candidate division KSB3 bacterium]